MLHESIDRISGVARILKSVELVGGWGVGGWGGVKFDYVSYLSIKTIKYSA